MQASEQTILIVDDESANRLILQELLDVEAKFLFASNGTEAINLAREHLPDLILLDVIMPDLSGFEVVERLKSCPTTMHVAVIFITGLANSDDEERGFSVGACDYIYKPFKPSIVTARVNMHLELIRQRKLLNRIVHVDALTGLANRRKLDESLEKEIQACKREFSTLLVALIDVDYFKQYNDHYGHGAGDNALKKVAAALKEVAQRPRDFVARYGGEEFLLMAPHIDELGSHKMLNNLILAIEDKQIKHEYSDVGELLTVSIGAALIQVNSETTSDKSLGLADRLLYRAKRAGRNQIAFLPVDAPKVRLASSR